MNNIYDDFRLCDEQKMCELVNAYNKKLNEVKIFSTENNFDEKLVSLLDSESLCLHYINNLIKTCKNKEDLNCLLDAQKFFMSSFENLKTLYEKQDTNIDENVDSNFSNNITGFFDSVFCFLQNLFDFFNFETNAKIKSTIFGLIISCIDIAKKINSQNMLQLKVFSLFARK